MQFVNYSTVVTWGGDKPGTLYLHADHLGSVDALTNEKGGIEERRSYDAFGQRRNPIWGQAPPASFASKTTKGFTGHEHDNEFGLVNAKGRIYDPKIGRFLSTDPTISNLYFAQSFNRYAYVLNNPLSYIDPSGFQATTRLLSQPGDIIMPTDHIEASYETQISRYLNHQGPAPKEELPAKPKEKEDARQAGEVGAAAPPTDVDTTGSTTAIVAQVVVTLADAWIQSPHGQLRGGFAAGEPPDYSGRRLGRNRRLGGRGSQCQRETRFGLAAGQIVGGIASMARLT
ncbi:MAG: hypothetical protein HUU21_12145 [Polyangiaceae bacterium]|nr:hypothetical protein [Polyangiaceae bacterium]